jgi:murein DD-endopeptidase MepM/ murein hydrolase activator NlpD
MNIILVGKYRGKSVRFQVGGRLQMAVYGGILTTFLMGAGFLWGSSAGKLMQLVDLEDELTIQKNLIQNARTTAQLELDALAARIGQLQAHVTRLDALGGRLIKISRLDPSEFDFAHKPAYGGPHEPANGLDVGFEDVLVEMSDQLDSREQQLSILEDVIMSRQLKKESRPTGRPIGKGWISSYFGKRTDPFTGKLAMHKGMDFAAKQGSAIIAVSSGVVTWSGKKYGYGNLIEINHGHGYSTRYGHNDALLVEVGDTVEKGQVISKMGSTGRSTGPHVHFEVLLNDRQVDPMRFVQSSS